MRHLCIVIDVQLVAVFLRQPLAGQSQARVDTNPLVRDLNRIVRWLIRDIEALFRKGVNTSRARRAELSGEHFINLNSLIDGGAREHSRITTDARKRLAL